MKNFWMKTAYRISGHAAGRDDSGAMKAEEEDGTIGRMPVRSFLISPDGSGKIRRDGRDIGADCV